MQTQRTLGQDLKHQFKHGGMTIKLIFVNVAVWLIIGTLGVIARNAGESGMSIANFVRYTFYLQTEPGEFITHPWGLVTSIFSHLEFFHIAFNMLLFYFAGRMFEQEFDQKRLFYTYLIGGIFGSIFQVAATFLPTGQPVQVIGASGSVMAVFMAMAFYRPRLTVNFFGILPVPLWVLAAIFFLKDFFALGAADGTAHFSHLGGAILGMASVMRVHSSNNIINVIQRFGDWIQRIFSFKRRPKMQKLYGDKNTRMKTDEEYNMEENVRQEEIDHILDKISKSGYDSLTKKEKDFLFRQSKK